MKDVWIATGVKLLLDIFVPDFLSLKYTSTPYSLLFFPLKWKICSKNSTDAGSTTRICVQCIGSEGTLADIELGGPL